MRKFLDRFDAAPGLHTPRPVRNGLICLGLFLAVMAYLFTDGHIVPLPKSGTIVRAEFPSAANIQIPTTTVRVRGVNVGKIEKVERRPGGGVRVEMRVDEKGFKVRRDARAHIQWRTLLGYQFYIDLEPGSSPERLGDHVIPLSATTTQAELDQVLAAVDKPSRAGLRAMLREFDKGFTNASEPGRAIDTLGPTMRVIAPGIGGLRGQKAGDLADLVRDTSRVTGALAKHEVALGQLVETASTTLGVTAARRAALAGTLRDAPAALDETHTAMARLRTTLAELDPIADRLRPGARRLYAAARQLRPALAELDPVLATAHPLLRDLRPSLRRLDAAARSGTPLLAKLDPTLVRTRNTLLPWLDKTDGETRIKNYQAIGPVFATVSDSAQQFDINGHTQRFNAASGGGRSLGFAPCHVDFPNGSPFTCPDLQNFVKGLLGAPPAGTARTGGDVLRKTLGAVKGGRR